MMLVPAPLSIASAEVIEELVTVVPAPWMQVSELVSSENLSAPAFEAMIRRYSLPPGTFLACFGTTYWPAAPARAAPYGCLSLAVRLGTGTMVSCTAAGVVVFISLASQVPHGSMAT